MRLLPIFLLVVATTLIRLGFAATTGLGVDESYMVTAGRLFSLGYFDHPPASWWLSWGAAHLLGTETPVAVRLPFILLFAVSQILMWRIGCLVADRRAGLWAAIALNLSPVFGVTTGSWVLPDGPLDAALLGAVLCLLHALSSGDQGLRSWSGAGLCAGLALFSKYTAVLPIGGALLYLLTHRRDRRWLARPGPYIAVALASAVFAPVPVWNALHGWASFTFQGDRAAGLRFRPLMPLTTLAGEALFVLPWIWLPMMLLFIRGFRRDAPWQHRLLVWLAAPPIVCFALISAWSSQRILFHWAAPGYLMLFPLLGEAIGGWLDRVWVRALIAGTTALVLVALVVISAQIQFDWLGGSLTEVMRKDPTDQALDWTSLRDDLRARGLLPPGTVAAALNWRDAGKIGYALGPGTTMLCLSQDSRQFGFAYPPRAFAGQEVLLLALEPAEQVSQEAKRWFHGVQVLPNATIRDGRRVLRTVTVLQGEGFHPGR
ncbi:ArnT family glycosyltransferase [Rhodopila sp.]|uniref:ArnT family glycosyltransferase n=1 Tax=Rhodopila sp. TaxID=2480087 RepID=UPI003D09AA08